MPQPRSRRNRSEQEIVQSFKHIALGGTFDRFHKGHREFLNEAFNCARWVTIGITDDRYAAGLHASPILEPYAKRRDILERFLIDRGIQERGKITVLKDVFGTTIEDDSVQALAVTKNTIEGARVINQERRKRKKSPLHIIKLPLAEAQDGKPISSQRIRMGELSREGVVYAKVLLETTPLRLPRFVRPSFRDPFGDVIPADTTPKNKVMENARILVVKRKLSPVICVGDVVTQRALRIGFTPTLAVVDLFVQRQKHFSKISEIGNFSGFSRKRVVNPPGVISEKLVRLIRNALEESQPTLIRVEGEEDLAVLPAVLLAPLQTAVIYGHFQYGVIVVSVTEEKKSEALQLVGRLRRMAEDE